MWYRSALLALLTTLFTLGPVLSRADAVQQLRFPPGYKIEKIADVENARQMAIEEDGTLFVGSLQAGRVYRIRDGVVETLLSGLEMPSGLTLLDGQLYIAAFDRILQLDHPLLDTPGPLTLLSDQLPAEQHHGWKYLKSGPDGQLYFNIGAPCNVCLHKDKRFATLARLHIGGGPPEIIAEGVRNSVGFDWHPDDLALWFTDNGRDWLGDDRPDDELNRLGQIGQHFGFPYEHGDNLPDPQYGRLPHPETVLPEALLGAHVAPLGMAFTQQEPWAEPGETALFIAQHGSWNRSEKVGYRVVRVRLQGNEVIDVTPFVQGWLQGSNVWGRPVDVVFDQRNNLLISDDHGNAIYRMSPLK